MKLLARWLRDLADRLDRVGSPPEPECDLYDEESLNATEYALVSMRLSSIEGRLADLEDVTGLADRSLAAALLTGERKEAQ